MDHMHVTTCDDSCFTVNCRQFNAWTNGWIYMSGTHISVVFLWAISQNATSTLNDSALCTIST